MERDKRDSSSLWFMRHDLMMSHQWMVSPVWKEERERVRERTTERDGVKTLNLKESEGEKD